MRFEEYIAKKQARDEEIFDECFNDMMKDVEKRIETIKDIVLKELQDFKDVIEIYDRSLVICNPSKYEKKCPQMKSAQPLMGQYVEIAIHDWLKELGYFTSVEWGSAAIEIFIHPVALKEKMEQYEKNKQQYSIQGLSVKQSVIVASTEPVDLDWLAPNVNLDGRRLQEGDRILLKDQTNPQENGIYIIGIVGPPVRSTDMDWWTDAAGIFTFVESGTTNASSGWVVTNTSGRGWVGRDAIIWAPFSGAGQLVSGNKSQSMNTEECETEYIKVETPSV